MADSYEKWLIDVQAALQSINMPFDDWQNIWRGSISARIQRGREGRRCRYEGEP
jgi:hypothetical protein